MTITVCWSAKGGSGTTVVAATLALSSTLRCTLVDLDGELPAVLGHAEPVGQGIADWIAADAPAAAADDLAVEVDATTDLVPRGAGPLPSDSARWTELAAWWAGRATSTIVDAGTGTPPSALLAGPVRSLLVTRACYLSLRRAVAMPRRPDGIVLVAEPGRALRRVDVEGAIGAPVVATVSLDPAVARAVDAGLLAARLPRVVRRELSHLDGRPRRHLLQAVR